MNYLWLYWEDDGIPEPGFIRLCRQTIERHCGGDFDIVLTTPDNIRDYLPDTRIKFESILTNIHCHAAVRAAYIRVALLHRYGGMWIDSDTIMLRSLWPIWEKTKEKGFSALGRPTNQGLYGMHFSNCLLGSVEGGEFITKYMDYIDDYVANCPRDKQLKRKTYVVPWLQLGTFGLSPLVVEFGADRIHYEPYWKVQPMLSSIWKRYFEDLRIEEMVSLLSESISALDLNEVYCFTLCNQSFPMDFRRESEQEIMNKKTLIARLFKRSLGGANF